MGGKGELVDYTREYYKKPLSANDKAKLKAKINGIIDGATQTITVIVLLEGSTDDLLDEAQRRVDRARKKSGG